MQDHLARLAGDGQVGQDHRLGGGVVPVVTRRFLVVPLVVAGVRVQRDDGGQVQVVAALGAARAVRPGRPVAGAHVHQVQLRVEHHRIPHGAAATGLPPLAARVPRLGGAAHGFVFKRLAGVARHAVPAPDLLAGFGVVGGDVAAHAVLGAAVADDHLALEHARRAGAGVGALLAFDGVLFPDHLAGDCVQRDQPSVERAHVDLALPQRHAAVDHVAAALRSHRAVHLRVVRPQLLAGARVNGVHHAPGRGDVHHAVDHDGRGLHAARGFQVVRPGQAQLVHVAGVDLAQAAVARLGVVHADGGPVGRLGSVGADEGLVHLLDGRSAGRGRLLGGRGGGAQAQRCAQCPADGAIDHAVSFVLRGIVYAQSIAMRAVTRTSGNTPGAMCSIPEHSRCRFNAAAPLFHTAS